MFQHYGSTRGQLGRGRERGSKSAFPSNIQVVVDHFGPTPSQHSNMRSKGQTERMMGPPLMPDYDGSFSHDNTTSRRPRMGNESFESRASRNSSMGPSFNDNEGDSPRFRGSSNMRGFGNRGRGFGNSDMQENYHSQSDFGSPRMPGRGTHNNNSDGRGMMHPGARGINQGGRRMMNQDGRGMMNQDGRGMMNQDGRGMMNQDGRGIMNQDGRGMMNQDSRGMMNQDGRGIMNKNRGMMNKDRGMMNQDGRGIMNQDARGLMNQDARGLMNQDARGMMNQDARGIMNQGGRGVMNQGSRGLLNQGSRGMMHPGDFGINNQGAGGGYQREMFPPGRGMIPMHGRAVMHPYFTAYFGILQSAQFKTKKRVPKPITEKEKLARAALIEEKEKRKGPHKPWMTPELQEEIQKKKSVLRRYIRTNKPEDRVAHKIQRSKVCNLIKKAQMNYCEAHPEEEFAKKLIELKEQRHNHRMEMREIAQRKAAEEEEEEKKKKAEAGVEAGEENVPGWQVTAETQPQEEANESTTDEEGDENRDQDMTVLE